MRYLFLILSLAMISQLQAQISRDDLEKKTSKGLESIKKGDLEGAIEIFNDILKKDPTEGKALLLRARTKYELSAYKGAKKDCFAYMDIYGIDAEVAGLLGKTEKAMENFKQALAYLKTALLFDPEGIEYLMDRADIYYNLGLDDQACDDWIVAEDLGNQEASRLLQKHCRRYISKLEEEKKELERQREEALQAERDRMARERREAQSDIPIVVNKEQGEVSEGDPMDYESETQNEEGQDDEPDYTQNSSGSENNETNETNDESVDVEPSYPIDDHIEEIYIDDELTIIIADGVGSRKLVDLPDILILSDKSGQVVVNICVDRLGRVVNPTLNEEFSTIKTPSLVSLALRESSNFRFARSSRKSHCGTITFSITGSE